MSALIFQTTVLYPWHNELDADFKKLKEVKEHQEWHLEEYNAKKMKKIEELEEKLAYLELLEEKKSKIIAEKQRKAAEALASHPSDQPA